MSFPSPFYRWRPHPWHGLAVGPDPPLCVSAYIEITPFDLVSHYFMTYKMVPGTPNKVSIDTVYGRDHALRVVEASMADYREEFGE